MIAKIEVLNHSNNVFAIFRVIVFYVLKQSNFNHPLLLKFLLVPHYFKGNINVFLMIKTKQDYSKGSFSQLSLYFISKLNVIMGSPQILSIVVIISTVIWTVRRVSACFSIKQIHKINSFEFLDLIHFRWIKERNKSNFCFRFSHRKSDFVFKSVSLAWGRDGQLLWLLNAHIWNYCRYFLLYFKRIGYFSSFIKWLRFLDRSRWIKDLKRIWYELIYFLSIIL